MNARQRASRALLDTPHLPIAAYLGIAGWLSLAQGGFVPASLEGALPSWLVFTWTLGLAVGGPLAVAGRLAERTRMESVGLVMLAWGAGLYGMVLLVVAWPVGATAGLVAGAVCSMCGIRLHILTLARRARSGVGEQ